MQKQSLCHFICLVGAQDTVVVGRRSMFFHHKRCLCCIASLPATAKKNKYFLSSFQLAIIKHAWRTCKSFNGGKETPLRNKKVSPVYLIV